MKVISRILLVDDDATYLFLTQRLLRQLWAVAEVRVAVNGEAALRMLQEGAGQGQLPELIISDIDMPVMNGLAFMKELQRLGIVDFKSTRLVLNSSSLNCSSVDSSEVGPAVALLSKPLTREKLLSVVG